MSEQYKPQSGKDDEVMAALKVKKKELAAELEAVLNERDLDIEAAKAKYAAALKEIKAKQGRLKRMVKSSEKL